MYYMPTINSGIAKLEKAISTMVKHTASIEQYKLEGDLVLVHVAKVQEQIKWLQLGIDTVKNEASKGGVAGN